MTLSDSRPFPFTPTKPLVLATNLLLPDLLVGASLILLSEQSTTMVSFPDLPFGIP